MKYLYIVCEALRRRFTEIRLARPIILLHFLIFRSIQVLKLRFESKTTSKRFLISKLRVGCNKIFETNLWGK